MCIEQSVTAMELCRVASSPSDKAMSPGRSATKIFRRTRNLRRLASSPRHFASLPRRFASLPRRQPQPPTEKHLLPNNSTQRILVILNLPRRIPALITYAQNIVTCMSGSPHFPTPTPALAEVSTAISALQTAEVAALSRTKGAVVVRNDRKRDLVTLLQELRG